MTALPVSAASPEAEGRWIASVAFGLMLGVVGASIGRAGLTGLLAGPVVPVGAVVEMAWLPRWGAALDPDPALEWVRIVVWIAATLSAIGLICVALMPRLGRVSQ